MFDGKYFSNYVRQYFPTKTTFQQAKTDWANIAVNKNHFDSLISFLNKYFFDLEININEADKFVFGNDKGSALKMLILFQEIILNAIKFSSFVNKSQRKLKLIFKHDYKFISITIENTFDEKIRVKTSGIGHVIIENFAHLLDTNPVIKKKNNIYSLEIKFENFWEAEFK